MNTSANTKSTRTWDKIDSPDDYDKTVVVPSQDIFDNFTTFDDRLSGSQCSANDISTKPVTAPEAYNGSSSCKIWGGIKGRVALTLLFSSRSKASLKGIKMLSPTVQNRISQPSDIELPGSEGYFIFYPTKKWGIRERQMKGLEKNESKAAASSR